MNDLNICCRKCFMTVIHNIQTSAWGGRIRPTINYDFENITGRELFAVGPF